MPGEEKYRCASSQPEEKLDQNESDICEKTKSLSVITKDEGFTEANFIGLLDQYCAKTDLIHNYILENKCSSSHNPQFFYKLVIDNKEYPVGEGKSAMEAKQNAAQLASSALQEQTDWDSKDAVVPKEGNTGNRPSEKTSTQSESSRFKSDFDCEVVLGKGAFGQVHKAKHKLTKKDYAVKIVRFKEVEKALREVRALSDLNHCNIVRYYTCWLEDSGHQWDNACWLDDSGYQRDNADDSSSPSNSSMDYSCRYIFALGLIFFEVLWKIPTGHERVVVWPDIRKQRFPQGFRHSFPDEYFIIRSTLCVKPEERPEASKLKTNLERLKTEEIMRRSMSSV
ncbi:eukaryotic translation initiation factor 2-alpha kinase 3 isoform X2 [Perca flavescens]|uniref:eukaryotic translation initiation factor 2-alpha kinase 3 isoform X2 n=1 Tax=Perca flavescens TaxID=8167 RepID=UPI00106EFFFB|nr:eukaryotic translation initiation factor 2-alpha kinase 3-like isoform X2 [Perca flavescens]